MQRRTEREARRRDLAYFTPPAMVDRATERRLAGDWRGACAAANVAVDVAFDAVLRRYGREAATTIRADLAGLAPDLVRRFVPRVDGGLRPATAVVLSRAAEIRDRQPFLVLTTPGKAGRPQRLWLGVHTRSDLTRDWYDLPAWCWHADARDERRHAYGASPTRLPWHTADGRPYRAGEVAPADAPRDRATEVETIEALRDAGRLREAWAAAGIAGSHQPLTGATDMWYLAAEVRRLAARYGVDRIDHGAALSVGPDGTVTGDYAAHRSKPQPRIVPGTAPLDAALLHRGDLTAGDLHPLVHDALFPGAVQEPRPVRAHAWPEMRVRCGPDWHLVRLADGKIVADRHDEVAMYREEVLGGLGGPLSGCGAAVRAWHTGHNPMPKQMRKIRQDVFSRAFHGDTETLVAMLDAGLDPDVRDGGGATLAHYLSHVDHERLLPVLLAAGARLDRRDGAGRTPWDRATEIGADGAARALDEAGAGPSVVTRVGYDPAQAGP